MLGPIDLQDAGGREVRSVIDQLKRLALLACLVVGPRGFRRSDAVVALFQPRRRGGKWISSGLLLTWMRRAGLVCVSAVVGALLTWLWMS